MIINASGLDFYLEQFYNTAGSNTALLLHGFTGSSEDWRDIIPHLSAKFNYYTIDFIGHGNSASPSEEKYYELEFLTRQLNDIFTKITNEKFVIIGYSMGGRAALSYSLKYPGSLKGLILESSTAGIKDYNERHERIKKDKNLSEFILNHSIEEFIEHWMNMEIFNTQKRFANSRLEAIKKSKLKNSKTGLSNTLEGLGTGKMPNYFGDLNKLNLKTLLITGDLDEKFTLINEEMAKNIPFAEHVVIKNSGHNTHLETPAAFIKTVNTFLEKL